MRRYIQDAPTKDLLDSAMSAVLGGCYRVRLARELSTVPLINKNVINAQMGISFKITFAKIVQRVVPKLGHQTVSVPSAKMAISIQDIDASKISTKLTAAIYSPATKAACIAKRVTIR